MSEIVITKSLPQGYHYMQEPLKHVNAKGEPGWGTFIEPWGEHNVTLVHLAAYSGNLQMLQRAVELGADLTAKDGYERSALHHAAFYGRVDIVKWLLDQSCCSKLMVKNFQGNTPLHAAIKSLRRDASRTSTDSKSRSVAIVDLLVKKGAKVNAINDDRHSPLYLVGDILIRADGGPDAVIWYEKVVKILTSASVSANTRPNRQSWTPLHHAVCLGSKEATRLLLRSGALVMETDPQNVTALHVAAGSRYHEILDILLENIDGSAVGLQDSLGRTFLHYAADTGHSKNFRTLVDRGEHLLAKTKDDMTVLDVLFKNCADPVGYLTGVLDTRVRYEGDVEMNLDFTVLMPPDRPQMDVVSTLISAVANKEDMAILQHPLLETFLQLKWSKFRYFFLILFTVHVCFLLFLFWYAIVLLQTDVDSSLPRRLLLFCAIVLLCHNVLQLLTTPKSNSEVDGMQLYFTHLFCKIHCERHFEYWLSIICELMSIGVAIVGEFIPDAMLSPHHSWEPQPWLLNSVSVVIFFAGIQMMLVIGRFPALGGYTLMFSTVLKNVLKVFVAFVWFIVSFAFSFLIIFRGEKQFHDWWVAIVKTVAMTTGEYDYSGFLTETNEGNSTTDSFNSQNTLLPVTRGIVFLLFVMLANIVLMNIITALAVTDVKGLVKTGELLRLRKQAELLAHFERMTTRSIFSGSWVPYCLKKILKMKIANKSSIWRTMYVKRQWRRNDCISEELMKRLVALGQKNLESEKKSQVGMSCQEPQGDLTQIIFYLKKQIEELERRNITYSLPIQYCVPPPTILRDDETAVTVL